jgi:hypothetical protein
MVRQPQLVTLSCLARAPLAAQRRLGVIETLRAVDDTVLSVRELLRGTDSDESSGLLPVELAVLGDGRPQHARSTGPTPGTD